MALITATEARGLIPSLTGVNEDTELDTFIARCDAAMAMYCAFEKATGPGSPSLEQATYTWFFDRPDVAHPRELLLPIRPLISVTSVFDDEDWDYGSGDEVLSAEFILDLPAGRILLIPDSSHSWTHARRAIRVIAVAGLTTGSIPEFVKQACAETVKMNWERRHNQQIDTITVGGDTETPTKSEIQVPALAKALLSPLVIWERKGGSGAAEVAFG